MLSYFQEDTTLDLVEEILEDTDLLSRLTEEQKAYGNFSAGSIASFVHTELYAFIKTNLLYVNWADAAYFLNKEIEENNE